MAKATLRLALVNPGIHAGVVKKLQQRRYFPCVSQSDLQTPAFMPGLLTDRTLTGL